MFVSRCRIPTVFRQLSPSLFAFSFVLFLFYVSSFLSLLSQSFFFLLTSLVYICLSMSYSHCISSILTDFVCYFCRSFSFLRHYCIFVFRCCFPTVFRQFSPFLLAFSVILSFSYISIFDSFFCLSFLLFPTSLLCICLSMSYSHCISSILSDFVCLFCRSFVLPTSALSLLCLSLSLFPLLRSLLCICLSLKFPQLYFVNSHRPCFLSSRLRSLFAFSVVLFLSYVSPFLSLSFLSFLLLVSSLSFAVAFPLYFVNFLRLCLLSL